MVVGADGDGDAGLGDVTQGLEGPGGVDTARGVNREEPAGEARCREVLAAMGGVKEEEG